MSNQIELELAANSGPAWLAVDGVPVTVSFPAEAVRFEGEELCFLTGGSVVRTVPRSEVAALTWRANVRGRPGEPRNAGQPWTDEEREQLTAEVHGELSWAEIGRRHERSIAAVRMEAQKLGLIETPVRIVRARTSAPCGSPATDSRLPRARSSAPGVALHSSS